MITTALCFAAGALTAVVLLAAGYSLESHRQPSGLIRDWILGPPAPMTICRERGTLTVGGRSYDVRVEVKLFLPSEAIAGHVLRQAAAPNGEKLEVENVRG